MLRALLAFALIAMVAGCAAPQAAAGEGDGGAESRVFGIGPRAPQLAARRPSSPYDEVVPAAFTMLPAPALPRARPAVVTPARPLQCVPYARELSGIALRGDAWTWWGKAEGRYTRGSAPRVGAVLVLSKTRRLRLGHLAVVAEVRSSREIVVHQANWLNGGQVHRYTPVRDVSRNNDWSEVRVWYTPGRQFGARSYQAYGFIYPGTDPLPELRQAAN